ncbi:MAG: gliding motility protein GldN [Bergeyella sp.]|nr:gliding motility protein GldN [Bergeyella sp.]
MKTLLVSFFIVLSSYVFSQNILNAKSPEEFRKLREENKEKVGDSIVSTKVEPLKYGFIEDKDIIKSMVVWEIIDLNDKINQPIYSNTDGLVSQNKSLYQVLFDAIMAGKITEVYDDEMFETKIAPDQIKNRVVFETMSNAGIDKVAEQGAPLSEEQKKEYMDRYEVSSDNVKLIKIKGMWYIDKRDGQMKYRLLGIAPMGKDPTAMGQFAPDGTPMMNDEYIDLFWVFYPDAREVLANSLVFNNRNLSSDISFDDILNARRFSSVIYKSGLGPGNGVIADYIPNDAEEQLEESDRIKDKILQMENDMWNY